MVCLRGFSAKGHDVNISLLCWSVVDPFSDIMPLAQEDKIIQFSPGLRCVLPVALVESCSGHKNWLCSRTH